MLDRSLEAAVRTYRQWFGSRKASGELKKVEVWLTVNDGRIEFLTPGDSWKAKRVRKNARVTCSLGSPEGPEIAGRAEIVTEPEAIRRAYRAYWKTHPVLMLVVSWPIKRRIRAGTQVLIRVHPEEPNPLVGLTAPSVP